jgi:hypothetical protein
MKRLLSVFTAAALMTAAAPVSASAEQRGDEILQGIVDGVTYYYTGIDSPDMTVTITGAEGASGELAIPDSIDGYMVSAIGDRAFFCNSDITSVSFPDTLASIGDNAFAGCTSLGTVTLPDKDMVLGSGCFVSCTGLKHLDLGNSLACIPDECFLGCNILASAELPDSLECIGEMAFFGCTDLKKLVISSNVTEVSENAFGRCYDLRSDYIVNVEDFALYVYDTGCEAANYAAINSIPVILLSDEVEGDADLNGILSAADATAVLREYANIAADLAPSFNDIQKRSGDMDKDGMLTAKDASLILAKYANSQL